MPYVALLGPSAGVRVAPAGLSGCGCSAPRLPMSWPPAAPAPAAGLGFDLASFGIGSGTMIAIAAAAVGALLLFGPGASERRGRLKDETRRHREAISDETRRHREAVKSIKGRYTRLPRAVTYDREVY